MTALRSNFVHLREHDEQLLRLGLLAEQYFPEDPNTSLLKLRQLAELLAQHVATRIGLYISSEEPQYELIRRLQDHGIFSREIAQLFGEIRRAGNAANHALAGNHHTALSTLKIAWQLSIWFHRTFKDPAFKSGVFIPPKAPADETDALRAELEYLNRELAQYRAIHQETAQQLEHIEEKFREARDEQAFWEQLATETENANATLAQQLAAQQTRSETQPKSNIAAIVAAAGTAATAIHLDEAETRKLIDEQLRLAGWTVDTAKLKYAAGARPEKGKNLAIAEWPTESGPADYVLFVGLTPMAIVEAKRKNTDVPSALQQAKRYSRGFKPSTETTLPPQTWGGNQGYRLPFVFSCNGRPYLRQLATKSGVWFCDLRQPDNLSHALNGWYTPGGLVALFKQDDQRAHKQLETEPFAYGFTLRPYFTTGHNLRKESLIVYFKLTQAKKGTYDEQHIQTISRSPSSAGQFVSLSGQRPRCPTPQYAHGHDLWHHWQSKDKSASGCQQSSHPGTFVRKPHQTIFTSGQQ